MYQVIHLHVDAPPKPPEGDPCNGCGVCCSSQPCPVGVLVSRRRSGACAALQWSGDARRYTCGLVVAPASHLPRGLHWAAPIVARLAHRFIAAGIGCDCDLDAAAQNAIPYR